MAKKTRVDKERKEEEGEEIYHDVIGEERRVEESSRIKEKGDIQKKVERSVNVQNFQA